MTSLNICSHVVGTMTDTLPSFHINFKKMCIRDSCETYQVFLYILQNLCINMFHQEMCIRDSPSKNPAFTEQIYREVERFL